MLKFCTFIVLTPYHTVWPGKCERIKLIISRLFLNKKHTQTSEWKEERESPANETNGIARVKCTYNDEKGINVVEEKKITSQSDNCCYTADYKDDTINL